MISTRSNRTHMWGVPSLLRASSLSDWAKSAPVGSQLMLTRLNGHGNLVSKVFTLTAEGLREGDHF